MDPRQKAATVKPMTGKNNFLLARQAMLFTQQEITHLEESIAIKKFLLRMAAKCDNTAVAFKSRLASFAQFVFRRYDKIKLDDFISDVKAGKHDPYDVLSEFASFLKTERTGKLKLSANSIIAYTKTGKRFLRISGIKVNNEDFRDLVGVPRKEQVQKDALTKNVAIEILNGCKDLRLKSFLLMEGVTGCRPIEGCAIRLKDINVESNPATVTFRAEYAKTRIQRTRFLTKELTQQLKVWLDTKYRGGRARNPNDLLFANWIANGEATPSGIYNRIRKEFAALVDILGRGEFEDNDRRRKITIYSFRRFVKTTMSNQGYFDFSKWWIGHSLDADSTYFRQSHQDTIATFRKLEPYLTFLDVSGLEAKGADNQTRIDQLQADLQKERMERERLYNLLYAQGIIKKEPNNS